MQHSYNDTLVGPQLAKNLPKSVYLDGNWCCYTEPRVFNDITINLTLDNMVYIINNYMIARIFDDIIVGYDFDNMQMVDTIVEHLDFTEGVHITCFNLTNTDDLVDVDNFELMNKEYESNYHSTPSTNQLIKTSSIDTTQISAFKVAKIIEEIVYK